MTKYYTVSLPEKITKKIDETIGAGLFSSRADFLKQAARLEFERLNRNKEAKHGLQ